jgi:hypothetical protein
MTAQPLDPNDTATADRRGPDNPDTYTPNPNLRSYIDTLDGRATNRYFYRAAYVDGAYNRSEKLSLASPPVWLPNVVPPRAPVITKVLGGDRRITVAWASNREPDLAEYRVYRADSAAAARDLRSMTLVHTEPVPAGDPLARPAQVRWTDTPVPALVSFYYRVAAVDTEENVSDPSATVQGRAVDDALPVAPPLTVEWTNGTPPLAHASWTATEETILQRRVAISPVWDTITDWLPAGAHTLDDPINPDFPWFYRLQVRKPTGAIALGSRVGLLRRS